MRRGVILHRLGDHDRALRVLSDGVNEAGDRTVRYWGWLFRGQTLAALGRLGEAARSYERALDLWPRAQTAAAALAAVQLLQGERLEAERGHWSPGPPPPSVTTRGGCTGMASSDSFRH